MSTLTVRIGASSDDSDLGEIGSLYINDIIVIEVGKEWTCQYSGTGVPVGVGVGDTLITDPNGGGPSYRGPYLITDISSDRLTLTVRVLDESDIPKLGENHGFQRCFDSIDDAHSQIATLISDGTLAATDHYYLECMSDGAEITDGGTTWNDSNLNTNGDVSIIVPFFERHKGLSDALEGFRVRFTSVTYPLWFTFGGSGAPATLTIRGLDMVGINGSGPEISFALFIAWSNSTAIDKCLIHDFDGAGGSLYVGIQIQGTDADNVIITNCTVFNIDAMVAMGFYLDLGNNNVAANCLAANIGKDGILGYGFQVEDRGDDAGTDPMILHCCSISINGVSYQLAGDGDWHTDSDYNASDEVTGAGIPGSNDTGSVAYDTTTYTNVTENAEDFHLVVGSALIAAGDIDGGDAATYVIDNDDWEGETRPAGLAWDIGPDQFPSIPVIGSATFRGVFRGIHAMMR